MNSHADKTQKTKSQSAANTVSKKQSYSETTFQLVDNRPEVVAQRKLQEMMNHGKRVTQLKAFQGMVCHREQEDTATQLQKNEFSPTTQLSGNTAAEIMKRAAVGLLAGAALCAFIKTRPQLAAGVLTQIASVIIPGLLGAYSGYLRGKSLDEAAEWAEIEKILIIFPNKEPGNLGREISIYETQQEKDENNTFIVSYKNSNEFERALDTGQGFLWVYTVEKDLRIGSKQHNQHSVVGGGGGVYSAGEGSKPSVLGADDELIASIAAFETKAKESKVNEEVYRPMIANLQGELDDLIKNGAGKNKQAEKVVEINLRSGHYAPTIDNNRWKISQYAWNKSGYKAEMIPGGSFLPKEEPEEESKKQK